MPTYIYAITSAGHPLRLDGLKGVGDPANELRTVCTDVLAAVVSDAPADLRAKRRDLVAHQGVQERLLSDGSALPMRFGLVGPDDDDVRQALQENEEAYAGRLEDVEGCLEYNLKAARDEDDLLREIVQDSSEARRLNERTRANPDAQSDKVALGELIAREVQVREEREASALVDRLAPYAVRHALAEPTKSHFLNVSFLVRRDEAATLAQEVDEESKARGDAYTLTLRGPLPPYSFV